MNLGGVIRLNRTGICILFGATLVLFIYMLTNSNSGEPPSLKINLKHLLKVAIKAAENGGLEVVAAKDNPEIKNKGLTKEGLPDRVTSADFRSHCAIMKTLKHAYPSLNVVSEEKTRCQDEQKIDFSEVAIPGDLTDGWADIKDVTVWIDPLDATFEYTGKLFQYVTTMVCVAVKGHPVIGVIHKPFEKDQTFWAWVNKAKSPNLKFEKSESDKLKIIVSLSHSGEIKKVLSENFKNFEVISAAGSGYKSVEVALGHVDAYVHITAIKKWDICAGNAIIKAMGGQMSTKFNEEIDYKDESHVVNERGLVATITNHEHFIDKL